jgi:hypothetical protein
MTTSNLIGGSKVKVQFHASDGLTWDWKLDAPDAQS